MNAGYGTYQVIGHRKYRGHQRGETFDATLDRNAERRAVARGDIVLLARVVPTIQPGSYTFPQGWLTKQQGGT